MKILSASATHVGTDWIASLAFENMHKPFAISFLPFEDMLKNVDVPTLSDTEESAVIGLLSKGYPVHVIRTKCAPNAHPSLRYMTSTTIDLTNTDKMAIVYSETPGTYDVMDEIFYPDQWPKYLAKAYISGYTHPVLYLGDAGGSEDTIYTEFFPGIDNIAGSPVVVRHNDKFAIAASVDDYKGLNIPRALDVTQDYLGIYENKHHYLPINGYIIMLVYTDVSRNISVSVDAGNCGMSIAGTGYSIEIPDVADIGNKAYRISAGGNTMLLYGTILPSRITVRDTITGQLWSIPITGRRPRMCIEYQTTDGVWTSYSTNFPGGINNIRYASDPIINGSHIRMVADNIVNDVVGSATYYNYYNGSNWIIQDTVIEPTLKYSYPLSLLTTPTQGSSYIYRRTFGKDLYEPPYPGVIVQNALGVQVVIVNALIGGDTSPYGSLYDPPRDNVTTIIQIPGAV